MKRSLTHTKARTTSNETGQTIKGSMGPKIGFGGVAYRWIENFYVVKRRKKAQQIREKFVFKKWTSLFVFAFACTETPTNDACAC